MSLKDLTAGDFSYFKAYASQMQACHEKEFVKQISPDLLRAMYRGKTDTEQPNQNYADNNNYYREEDHLLALVKMFQAANTILPNLYFQNPSPIVIPARNSDPQSAALMCSVLKYYKKLNQAKKQNQEAVLNAYFFGIGWKKIGYRTIFAPRVKEPESEMGQDFLSRIKQTVSTMIGGKGAGFDKSKPDSNESREAPEIADYETLFNDSENPMNVMTDHKNDLFNAKARLYCYNRTLYDILNNGTYDKDVVKELAEMFKRKNGTRFDDREVEFVVKEMHIMQRNGLWILAWIDEFPKPLRYDKSGYQGKSFLDSPLVLTNEPGIRYPISHMKVASNVQKKLDKLATMYVEMVARSRRMLAVNTKILQPGQEGQLESNLIQGILKVKGPISPSDIQNITSAPVSNDLPQLMSILTQVITEVTGADAQLITGQSKNKTLGQDELARAGTQIRESGMTDRIRDWEVDQLQKEGTLIKQYSNTPLNLEITKSDYQDPSLVQQVEAEWVSFMTPENPLGLKEYLQGEFDYDVNIEEAIKPDKKNQQAQYEKIIMVGSNPLVSDALMNDGVQLSVSQIFKRWLEDCDGIGNPDGFLKQLDSQQLAALQTKKVLMQNGGQMLQNHVQGAAQAQNQAADQAHQANQQTNKQAMSQGQNG